MCFKRKAALDRPASQPQTRINVRGSDDAVAVGEKSFAAVVKVYFQGNWKPFAAVLFVVAALLGAILWFVAPRQGCCFTEKFGVAVAAFGLEDENGKVTRNQKGYDLSESIATVIRANLEEMHMDAVETNQVWGPDRTGLIRTEAEARDFAHARNASIVIYGRLRTVSGTFLISPQFYINPDKYQDAAEITGLHELGNDVQVRLNAAMPLPESPGLQARVKGLSMLTIGLVYYSVDQFDQALTYFKKADDPKWVGSGKDALYLLTGNAYIRQASHTQDFSSLAQAEQYYLDALEIDDAYGRAMIGEANVLYLRAITQANCDPVGLDEASAWLDKALDQKDQPASANIETKVHFYRGQIALIRYDCKLPGGDWAPAAEQEFNQVVQRYEADPKSAEAVSIQDYAASAYARLAYLAYYWHKDPQATIAFLNKAIPLASPAPKADYQSLLGDVYVVAGENDKAREAYQLALAAASGNGDQAKMDKLQEKLKSLSGP